MPALCAAASASAIWVPSERLFKGQLAAGQALCSVSPSEVLHDEEIRPVLLPDVVERQMCGCDMRRLRALHARPLTGPGVAGQVRREHLDGHTAVKAVSRAR